MYSEKEERRHILEDPDFHSQLEYWLSCIFPVIEFTKKHGIWCDGIALILIEQIKSMQFRISGVGYFPDSYQPFELEFHFRSRKSDKPNNIYLRFGKLDGNNNLIDYGLEKHSENILNNRPTKIPDWAASVEVTPDSN